MNDISEIKSKILEEIEKKSPSFRKISSTQYRMRCVFCGDSEKNPNAAHMYLKCDLSSNEPILYNCFKGNCNAHGKVNKKFLDKLNISIDNIGLIDDQIFNKIPSIKDISVDVITGNPDMNSDQVGYIEYRIGKGLNYNDFDNFKIIWDMHSIIDYISSNRVKNTLPNNHDSISFLSDDKSVMLTRFFNDNNGWKKTKLFPSPNRSFYTIKATLDLFSDDEIVINIAEGIFDILSIYKNFASKENSVNIAVLGPDYESGIEYVIAKGFIGNNIRINIYIDSDIHERPLTLKLKKYKWLFKEIFIYKNIREKDFGVHIDKIEALECKI